MQLLLVAQLLALFALANGTPVIAKDIFGAFLAIPLDGNARFVDGRPIFGPSKTFRGLLLSVLITSVAAPVIGLPWNVGAMVAIVAMAGDLFASFLKRRMKLPSGAKATGLDQLPESLFPALACRAVLPLTAVDIVAVAAFFFIGELLLSRVLYHFHLREHPY